MLTIAISIFLGITAILVAWVLGQSAAQAVHGYASICRELAEIDRRSRLALQSRKTGPAGAPTTAPQARREQLAPLWPHAACA